MQLSLCENLFKIKAMRVYANKFNDSITKMVFPIEFEDVIYIENFNRRTLMISTMGEFVLSTHFSDIKKFFLEREDFKSGHASYVINVNYIESFSPCSVTLMHDNKTYVIPVARRKAKEFVEECRKTKK